MMLPKEVCPGINAGDTTTIATATAANAKDTAHRRQDGYAAPTIEDRREHDLFAELKSLGYGITVPCLICSRPLTSKRSLATHVGPVCRARLTGGGVA